MDNILKDINSPDDLNSLSNIKLDQLAGEVREYIIETLSNTGGHLASNLGVVELTLALHRHLNSPKDKIVWDVGHQSYTHKIITGRRELFSTIRQYKGLSGYPKANESIHDIIETGHSATSISSALGLALARDLKGRNDRIFAVIGDGALTGGMAFEALNHAGHLGVDMKVILNDNEMSISPNVGALSHYLSNIRTDPTVNKLKEDVEFLINRIPKIGSTVSKTVERVKKGLKYFFISGILFEEMGFTYIGPLDGHNIGELRKNFRKADQIEGPVILHVNTKKGKGYGPAEREPSQYHGVGPFKMKSGTAKSQKENLTYSQVFGKTMVKLGGLDQDVVGITAAMPKGTGMNQFIEKYPERTFDVGIAEQHAVTLSAGLARGGKKPVVALYSTFLQRAYDQVIHDLCIQDLPVTIGIDRAGIVGNDGETHQGVFDYSFLRAIPNMTIMAPRNENELQHMLNTAVNHPHPTALRYPRGEGLGVELNEQLKELPIGKAEILREGSDLLIIAIGSRVSHAQNAADILNRQGISTGVINARFVKPLDRELLIEKISKCKNVVTVEEQALMGGFGSAILELINQENLDQVNLKRLGIDDEFVLHGKADKMRSIYHLNTEGIVKAGLSLINEDLEVEAWPKKNA
jgi:1-deoxy-D-xylulose-5-phosphate synthase